MTPVVKPKPAVPDARDDKVFPALGDDKGREVQEGSVEAGEGEGK